MDPTACLQRIFDAVKDNDHEEYFTAFEDLFNWLDRGGFSPTMPRTLKGADGKTTKQLRTNSSHNSAKSYAIQTVDPNSSEGPFEFVRYGRNGDIRNRFLLT